MKCHRCPNEGVCGHIGGIIPGDWFLCWECFKAWKKLGEDLRREFVRQLESAQADFLGLSKNEPVEEPQIYAHEADAEDFESESAEPVVPAAPDELLSIHISPDGEVIW